MYTERQLDICRIVLGTEEWRGCHRTSLMGLLQEIGSISNHYHTVTGEIVYIGGWQDKCGAGKDVQLVFDKAYHLLINEIIQLDDLGVHNLVESAKHG